MLEKLRETVAAFGITGSALYQSSKSTGWHLYIPFDDWAPSEEKNAFMEQMDSWAEDFASKMIADG